MVKKSLLPNGIKVVSKQMPHVRSISMGVWVNVGARDETAAQSGLSHFIEHMIFKGTTLRTAYQIAKEFDTIGGHTNAFTSQEHTCYHARVMDTHLETMVEILSDIFLNSVFNPNEVERERPVILQEIGMVEDSPEEYVHLLSGNHFWGDHPLGRSILGTRENILSFDAGTIKAFFQQFYQPNRIIIAVAGNVNHEYFVDLVEPLFSTIKPGRKLPTRTTPNNNSCIHTYPRILEQAHICLATPGLPVADSGRFAFSLMNTILGGNMSSRLFQQIREQRGLAYSVYSFIASHIDTGMFGVYAGVSAESVRQTTALILDAMQALCAAPVEPDELLDAKEYTKGNLLLASENVDNQMVRLAQNEIHFDRYIPIKTIVEQIDAVTADEIQSLAQTLFQPDQMTLTLLGPLDERESFDTLIPTHFNS